MCVCVWWWWGVVFSFFFPPSHLDDLNVTQLADEVSVMRDSTRVEFHQHLQHVVNHCFKPCANYVLALQVSITSPDCSYFFPHRSTLNVSDHQTNSNSN